MVCERQELWLRVASVLREDEGLLSARVSERCFRELASYRSRSMPQEESRGTVGRLMDHIILCLERSATPAEALDEEARQLHDALVVLEQGIAARRVRMAIDFEDLLKGLWITRQEMWSLLQSKLVTEGGSQPWWELERLINDVFDEFQIGLSSSYLRTQSEQIAAHESSLAKWEEVVRSASQIRLKIPCREEFAATVRLQAEAIARRVQFDEEAVYDIIMAVGEVCDNAIEHGRSEMGVDVEYVMTDSEFRVEIRDYGPGFDPSGRGEEQPDLFAESGRGIFLMKNLMDRVEIDSKVGSGTRIVMSKSRTT